MNRMFGTSQGMSKLPRAVPSTPDGTARAAVVNRTHRIVRDEALRLRAHRQRTRALWIPLAICSSLLLVLCYAAWYVMAGYDLTPTMVPDASDQIMLLFLLWCLPITAVALGIVWFRRLRGVHGDAGDGGA